MDEDVAVTKGLTVTMKSTKSNSVVNSILNIVCELRFSAILHFLWLCALSLFFV